MAASLSVILSVGLHLVTGCFMQSLDLQMKMVSDNMQDKKQKARAADSDESFQGNVQNPPSVSIYSV